MRTLWHTLVVLLLAGCAPRQEVIQGPTWNGPRANVGSQAYYPPAALRLGVAGVVMVGCTITPDHRTEACHVQRETPTGWGFGEAAVRMHQHVDVPHTAPAGPAFFTVPFCTTQESCEAQTAVSAGWRRDMRAARGGAE